MQIPNDVHIASRSAGTPGQDKVLDLILGEKQGNRRLLLRVLAAGVDAAEAKLVQTDAKLESCDQERRGNVTTHQRISLSLRSVRGHFIVLIYPHHQGASLPTTAWTQDSTGLKVAWLDQTDEYRTTGTLTSPEFTISRQHLNFEVSGGNSEKLRLELLIDGQVVRTLGNPGVLAKRGRTPRTCARYSLDDSMRRNAPRSCWRQL